MLLIAARSPGRTRAAICRTFRWIRSSLIPNIPQQVFAGSDFGLYYTDNITVASPVWNRFDNGIPHVMIWDMPVDRGGHDAVGLDARPRRIRFPVCPVDHIRRRPRRQPLLLLPPRQLLLLQQPQLRTRHTNTPQQRLRSRRRRQRGNTNANSNGHFTATATATATDTGPRLHADADSGGESNAYSNSNRQLRPRRQLRYGKPTATATATVTPPPTRRQHQRASCSEGIKGHQ